MAHPRELSPNQRMADALLQAQLDITLRDFLAQHRSRGLSYEEIGQELFAATDRAVSVSYSTIKNWLASFGLLEVAS